MNSFGTKRYSTICFIAVLFFGICGVFISNMIDVSKFHYPFLFFMSLSAIAISFDWGVFRYYLLGAFVALFSPIFSDGGNSYLAFFQSMVLPVFWMQVGRKLDIQVLFKGFMYLTYLMAFGLILELSGLFGDYFPTIGYFLGDDIGQRYGSFGLNSLALGYFSLFAIPVCLIYFKDSMAKFAIFINIVLILFANSRGSVATLFIFLTFMLFCYWKKYVQSWILIFYGGILSAIALIFFIDSNFLGRVFSTFDFQADYGNLGRVRQWQYCIDEMQANPFGLGAGSMSPIGFEDDAIIETGIIRSCESGILQALTEYGPIIGATYVGLIFYLIVRGKNIINRSKQISNNFRNEEHEIYIRLILFSIVSAVAIQQIINSTLSIWTGALFFSFIGYINSTPKGIGARLPENEGLANTALRRPFPF